MYILVNQNTNTVMYISEKKFNSFSDNLILCEVESLPTNYDYLEATNIHEVIDTWIEKELGDEYVENGERVEIEVERSRTYNTCDLKACFRPKPTNEELDKLKEKRYGKLISRLVRQRYSQDDVEAIVNNYLSDPQDGTYQLEFRELQAYREQCKIKAHNEIYAE